MDRLSLSGRAGQTVAAYRSDFLHAWVVGSDSTPAVDASEVELSLADLEWGSLAVPAGAVPPPASALPVEVHHAFAGLQFLREHLWTGSPGAFGLVAHGGRVWAFRSGLMAEVEQLTGAPARVRWHEWEGGAPLAWCELGAAEVWRLSCAHGATALHAHYRPALAAIAPAPESGMDDAPFPRPNPLVALPEVEGRRARRRRQRREARDETRRASAPAPVAPTDLAPVVAPVIADVADAADGAPEPAWVPAPALPPRPPARPRPDAPRPAPARPAPRRARARIGTRTLLVGALVLLVVAALAAVVWGRKPLATLVVGSYAVDLASQPAGATVQVDGKGVPGKTPLTLELAPGDHRVDLAYGEYGSASFNLSGARGDHMARSAAWTGSLGVASADTTVRLAVQFDGQPWGTTPLWKDSVPIGRHRLAFRAAGVRAWEEEVQIHAGQSTRVNAAPVHVPSYGLVTARAELVSSDGVEDLEQMPVFVDGVHAGATPLDLKLDPGPHSVRIAHGNDFPSVHLIDVQAGGRYFATAQFGRPPDPLVTFDAPETISRTKAAPLTVRLAADLPLPVRQVTLLVKRAGGAFERVPADLSIVDGRAVGHVAFPALDPGAKTLTYYVEIETREGETYDSEVLTAPIVP